MSDPKGDKLFVSLSAAKVRKLLKGMGYGVRKVQSHGRNLAVVIHTATGKHLDELKLILADGCPCERESELAQPLEGLRNIGSNSADWLRDAGFHSADEVRRCGAVATYQRIRRFHPEASLNLLWALHAGLTDQDWRDLSDTEKQALLAELNED